MGTEDKVTKALAAIGHVTNVLADVVKLVDDTADMVAEAKKVATSDQAAEIDAALARLQARNDVEVPEAIAALRAQ